MLQLRPCEVSHWLLSLPLLIAMAAGGGIAQQLPGEGEAEREIAMLIEQLRDDKFEVREQAMRKLIEIGARALPAIEKASRDDDAEVAYRARRAIRAITVIEPEEQAQLRAAADRALHAGDNEDMVRALRRLCAASNASIDDHRWLGHAHQLAGRWKAAAEAYTAALALIDQQIDKPGGADAAPGDTALGRDALLRQRAALILVLGRFHRRLLDDSKTAAEVYALVTRHSEPLSRSIDELAETWKSIIVESRDSGKSISQVRTNRSRVFDELRYPLIALRELAEAQDRLGRHEEAYTTLRRLGLAMQCYYGNVDHRDLVAMDRLLARHAAEAPDAAGAIVIDPDEPAISFDLNDPNSLAKAYANDNQYWSFCVAPPAGKEFATLHVECDIEQLELHYGGQFTCWAMAGSRVAQRLNLGSIGWPANQPPGRAVRSAKFELEPGTGAVYFKTGSWPEKFQVHEVKIAATFRDRTEGVDPPPQPTPGYVVHNECLPKGGKLTFDGEPYLADATSHGMKPGRHRFSYTHPERRRLLSYEADFLPGAYYGMFINLDSPLESSLTNLRGFTDLGSSFVRCNDGRWLVAWESPESGAIRLAASDDLVEWSEPWQFAESELYGDPFTCISPSLHVDKDGTLWMAYFSNRLDLDRLNTGGYRLFLVHSKDGREWSTPRPLRMPMDGWPPGSVQMTTGPDGKFWMFYRLYCATADTPADVTTLEPLPIAGDANLPSHARNPHATFAADGRVHLVWDHFGQKLLYSRRDREGKWSPAVDVPNASGQVSSPQLVVRGEQAMLLYAHQGAVIRPAKFTDAGIEAGDPIRITDHVAPLTSIQVRTTRDGRLALLCGQDTVWLRAADEDKLFAKLFPDD